MGEEIKEQQFLGSQLKPEYAKFERAKAVVIPCPYDATASYKKGTKNGPQAIMDASGYMELFDDELRTEIFRAGIHTRPALALEELSPDAMVEQVKAEIREIIKEQKLPVR